MEEIEDLLEKLEKLEVNDLLKLFNENRKKIDDLIKLNERLIKKIEEYEMFKYGQFYKLGGKIFKEEY